VHGKKIKYGIIIFLLLAVALSIYSYVWHAPGRPLSKEINPDFRLAAHDLIGIFESDGSKSDRRYLNKVLSVSGVVKTIQKNDLGAYTISLGSHSYLPASVICALDSSFIPHSFFLRNGDTATIRGTYVGQAHDPILVQCIIEK
jgi:tRNA_anti-like